MSVKKVYYYFAGILGGVVAQIVYLKWGGHYYEVGWALFCMPFHFLISLPFGIITGHLCYLLEKKLNRGLGIRFVFLILTFILSTVFCVFLRVIIANNISLPG